MISDKDVSDHHAIIPTMEIERRISRVSALGRAQTFLLVCCKLLCASAEPYVYEEVTATFDCGGHSFTAKGKRVLSEGWREIDRIFRASLKEKPADGDGDTLPDFTEGQTFDGAEVSVTEHFTQPPKPYTEDTPPVRYGERRQRMIFPMRRSEKVLARLRPGRPSSKSWWQPDLWSARARA